MRMAAAFLCATVTAVYAGDEHDWWVFKTENHPYAYDESTLRTDSKTGLRKILLIVKEHGSYKQIGFTSNCHVGRSLMSIEAPSDTAIIDFSWINPEDSVWAVTRDDGAAKIATDIACARRNFNPANAGSKNAAIAQLNTLSN